MKKKGIGFVIKTILNIVIIFGMYICGRLCAAVLLKQETGLSISYVAFTNFKVSVFETK